MVGFADKLVNKSLLLLLQPPICGNGINIVRKKRQVVEIDERDGNGYELVERDETIKVYSGLYVNEASDLDNDEFEESLDQPQVVGQILLI